MLSPVENGIAFFVANGATDWATRLKAAIAVGAFNAHCMDVSALPLGLGKDWIAAWSFFAAHLPKGTNVYAALVAHGFTTHAEDVPTNELLFKTLQTDWEKATVTPPPPVPPPPVPHQNVREAVKQVASTYAWMPVNNGAALWNYAKAHGLQDQQTDEIHVTYDGEDYVCQVFNLGIVYAKAGDWGNIKVIPK